MCSTCKLWIDADACPVVDIAIRTARAHHMEVTLVCDDAHHMMREGASTITVLRGADSADLKLVNLLRKGDVVITQDYGLASLILAKKAKEKVRICNKIHTFFIYTLIIFI